MTIGCNIGVSVCRSMVCRLRENPADRSGCNIKIRATERRQRRQRLISATAGSINSSSPSFGPLRLQYHRHVPVTSQVCVVAFGSDDVALWCSSLLKFGLTCLNLHVFLCCSPSYFFQTHSWIGLVFTQPLC